MVDKSALMIHKPWRGAAALLPNVNYRSNPYELARDADALLVLTECEEFRRLEWERIYDMMARPLVIDGRNLLDPAFMREMDFEYHGFGCRLEDPVSVRLPAYAAKASSMDAPLPLVRPERWGCIRNSQKLAKATRDRTADRASFRCDN
jgi:UDP-glucose/GDP-mannose dehydrogenase family, UDP binding domain